MQYSTDVVEAARGVFGAAAQVVAGEWPDVFERWFQVLQRATRPDGGRLLPQERVELGMQVLLQFTRMEQTDVTRACAVYCMEQLEERWIRWCAQQQAGRDLDAVLQPAGVAPAPYVTGTAYVPQELQVLPQSVLPQPNQLEVEAAARAAAWSAAIEEQAQQVGIPQVGHISEAQAIMAVDRAFPGLLSRPAIPPPYVRPASASPTYIPPLTAEERAALPPPAAPGYPFAVKG